MSTHPWQRRCDRRLFLKAGVGGLAVAAVGGLAGCTDQSDPETDPAPEPREGAAAPSAALITQPEVVSSVDGVLALTLTAQVATVDVGAAQPVTTYTYDGILPGRTWEVRPGDTLRITVDNQLPVLPGMEDATAGGDHSGHDMMGMGDGPHDRPHEWTTTNLHTHGLHVSPKDNSDNPFISIAPGQEFDYEIAIPEDHVGGLHWYHPHRHGAVAQQVRGGMSGIIVVRGEIDNVPEVKAAGEEILVLQALELDSTFTLPDPIPDPNPNQAFYPRNQILWTVNGTMTPTVRMYPGEVRRWRILNAAEGKFASLSLEGHDLQVLAWDGLCLDAPEPNEVVAMSGGNRVEALVKAAAPGTYRLVLTPGSSQHPEIPGIPHPDNLPHPQTAELSPRTVLTLIVEGEGPEMDLPTALPVYDPPMPRIRRRRRVGYTVERDTDGDTFLDFSINGKPFTPDQKPYRVKLGTAEEWRILNAADTKYPQHAHAFHIHVNPFKVVAINGELLKKPLWRDTFTLSGTDGDSFVMQTHFEDFTGRFVEHCHVLTHEDLGMMEIIEVVP